MTSPARQPDRPVCVPSVHPIPNSIAMAIAFEARIANPAPGNSRNGSEIGTVERNTSRKTANAPVRSLRFHTECSRRVGLSHQPFAKLFDLRGCQHRRDRSGERVQDEALAQTPIAVLANRPQDPESACVPDYARHQIERRIHDPPGDIASERGHQHFPGLGVAALRHADRAGEREHHDHAEQNLRNPLERIENGTGR